MNDRYSLIKEDIVNSYILDNKENEIVVLCHTKRPDLGFKKLEELIEKANKYDEILENREEIKIIKLSNKMKKDMEECEKIETQGESKDCFGCHCSICLMQGY